ncbi:MAG TPA: SET domain-containing protein-lysine N-methyltransferase [Terriglobales bacterium]|nr:SET domain-containing protein-lysine N-methyltransferase [Terriglobales bacterium]
MSAANTTCNGSTAHLVVRMSNIHSKGCYTLAPIAEGTHIVEYTGERITPDEADARYEHREDTYLFGLDDERYVIDGDGVAAFINHSCNPNCESDEIDGHVWIIALRDIAAGEELTYDYCLYDGDDESPCSCGAHQCRGTLYSDEEMERRARELAEN